MQGSVEAILHWICVKAKTAVSICAHYTYKHGSYLLPRHGGHRNPRWSDFCGECLRILHQKELGFPAVRDRHHAGAAGQLIQQCAVQGRWTTAGLFSSLLALPDPLIPIDDGGWTGLVEPYAAGLVYRVGLYHLLYERGFQHKPHHHHRSSKIHTGAAAALDRHAWLGAVTVGILLVPKEWMRVVGITAGVLEVIVEFPLAFATAQQLGRFSLFTQAPIISLALVIVLVWPNLWQRLTGPEGGSQTQT